MNYIKELLKTKAKSGILSIAGVLLGIQFILPTFWDITLDGLVLAMMIGMTKVDKWLKS